MSARPLLQALPLASGQLLEALYCRDALFEASVSQGPKDVTGSTSGHGQAGTAPTAASSRANLTQLGADGARRRHDQRAAIGAGHHPTGLVRSAPGADDRQDQAVEPQHLPSAAAAFLLTSRNISPARGWRAPVVPASPSNVLDLLLPSMPARARRRSATSPEDSAAAGSGSPRRQPGPWPQPAPR